MEKDQIPEGREGTLRLALKALKSNPAYLTLFCLGLMGGPVVAVALTHDKEMVTTAAIISWGVFLVASLLVVAFVETRRGVGAVAAQADVLSPADQQASDTFMDSESAAKLAGRWHVRWYSMDGLGQRIPHEHDPEETAIVTTEGPKLVAHMYDASTESEYWLMGRLSSHDDVTLLYWSNEENSMLVGTVFLEVDTSFEAKGHRMRGWWRGRARDDGMPVTVGEVDFVRYGQEKLLWKPQEALVG